MRPLQHDIYISIRMVVPEHGGLQLARISQVCVAGAQIQTGGDGRVVNIVWIRHSITIAVDTVASPGSWYELHRPHGPVPDVVAVKHSMIGVGDGGHPGRSIQLRTQDGSHGVSECVHPPITGMVRLDTPDAS
jgi:hypothetical protein